MEIKVKFRRNILNEGDIPGHIQMLSELIRYLEKEHNGNCTLFEIEV